MDISSLGSALASGAAKATSAATATAGGPAFGDVLKSMMDNTVAAQKQAENLTLQAAQGNDVALHDVVSAISQAQTTLQTLVTVRDKAVEAYQEVMRMAV